MSSSNVPLVVPRLHPTARTIAVTSGKGGAAKSTTVAALARRLASNGHNVVVSDLDIPAPNAHIVGDMPEDAQLTAVLDTAEIVLPWTPHRYRIASPVLMGHPSVSSMVGLCSYANEVDVVIFDLPGGWTDAQSEVIYHFVDVIFAVSPPTDTALSDHAAHVGHILRAIPAAQEAVKAKDKRRKVEFPDIAVFSVETLTGYIGTLPDGTVTTVRRLDAVPPEEAAARFEKVGVPFAGTIPPAVDVKALSETDEIGALAALAMP